jgi:hypothetical protein
MFQDISIHSRRRDLFSLGDWHGLPVPDLLPHPYTILKVSAVAIHTVTETGVYQEQVHRTQSFSMTVSWQEEITLPNGLAGHRKVLVVPVTEYHPQDTRILVRAFQYALRATIISRARMVVRSTSQLI